MYASTQDFIRALTEAGELHRVQRSVSPVLDIAAITDQESKAKAPGRPSDAALRADPTFWDRGGRALLFEQVEGSDFPARTPWAAIAAWRWLWVATSRVGFQAASTPSLRASPA